MLKVSKHFVFLVKLWCLLRLKKFESEYLLKHVEHRKVVPVSQELADQQGHFIIFSLLIIFIPDACDIILQEQSKQENDDCSVLKSGNILLQQFDKISLIDFRMFDTVKKSWNDKEDFDRLELVDVDVGLKLDIEVLNQLLIGLAVHLVECHLLTSNQRVENDEFKMQHIVNRGVLG